MSATATAARFRSNRTAGTQAFLLTFLTTLVGKLEAVGDNAWEAIYALAALARREEGAKERFMAAQRRTITAIVAMAIIALIGTKILADVNAQITVSNNQLSSSVDNIVGGFAGAMGLIGVLFLVLIAGLILSSLEF